MKYTVEMGSDATIYIPNFILVKIGSGIQKLLGGIYVHRQHDDPNA
jgi:hypothetical protein